MPETIRLLYECGALQGDLNRYNFLMTDQGAIIFDFEVATIKEVVGAKESNGEITSLVEKFQDNSGIGKK
jgi:RIO-like serine/threonine protein kinase